MVIHKNSASLSLVIETRRQVFLKLHVRNLVRSLARENPTFSGRFQNAGIKNANWLGPDFRKALQTRLPFSRDGNGRWGVGNWSISLSVRTENFICFKLKSKIRFSLFLSFSLFQIGYMRIYARLCITDVGRSCEDYFVEWKCFSRAELLVIGCNCLWHRQPPIQIINFSTVLLGRYFRSARLWEFFLGWELNRNYCLWTNRLHNFQTIYVAFTHTLQSENWNY